MASITPPIAPQVTPVTELIEIMANIVEIGGISVITQDRVKKCESIVKRDFPTVSLISPISKRKIFKISLNSTNPSVILQNVLLLV